MQYVKVATFTAVYHAVHPGTYSAMHHAVCPDVHCSIYSTMHHDIYSTMQPGVYSAMLFFAGCMDCFTFEWCFAVYIVGGGRGGYGGGHRPDPAFRRGPPPPHSRYGSGYVLNISTIFHLLCDKKHNRFVFVGLKMGVCHVCMAELAGRKT